MAKYDKILRWAGPILVPMVIAGIRSLLKKKKGGQMGNREEYAEPQRDMLDNLVDAGIAGLTRGRGQGRGR